MPIIISKIEQQKKNSKRYSLFAGDDFIIGISEQCLLEFNIQRGMELSPESLSKIQIRENLIAAREQSWRYLSRRPHSTKEMRDKLSIKKYTKDIIDEIISDLTDKDYLNDHSFSKELITDEIKYKRSGPLLIKSKLFKKGIPVNIFEPLINQHYPTEYQSENCLQLAKKKQKLIDKLDRKAQQVKLGNYLQQKGFTWDIISPIISELFKGVDDETE